MRATIFDDNNVHPVFSMNYTTYRCTSYFDHFSKAAVQKSILFRPKYFSDGLQLNQKIKNRFCELFQESGIDPMNSRIEQSLFTNFLNIEQLRPTRIVMYL